MKSTLIKGGVVAAIALTVAAAPVAFAQTTTTADAKTPVNGATSETSATAEAIFDWQPGQQFVYETSSTAEVKAAANRNEAAQIKTTLTVLERNADLLTMFAQSSVGEVFTTGVGTLTPGPAFTMEVPVSGADPLREVKSAGLTGSPSPAFSASDLLAVLPTAGIATQSVVLPVINDVGEAKVSRTEAGDTISAQYNAEGAANVPGFAKTAVYSKVKKAYTSVDAASSASMQLPSGQTVSFDVKAVTKLISSSSVPADQLAPLKADISDGVPMISKLRTITMSEPEVIGAAVKEMDAYLAAHPEGVFAAAIKENREMLAGMAERATNWSKIKEGEIAPPFEAKTVEGKTVSLGSLKGKVVLLDFWATWCGPCVMEMPSVKKLYDEFKGEKFEIIGFSADQELSDLTDFVKAQSLTWPQVFEGQREKDSVMFTYGVMKFPTTVLVDAEGKIAVVDARGEQLHAAVEKLVKGTSK